MIARHHGDQGLQLCTIVNRKHLYLLNYQANKQLVIKTKYQLNVSTIRTVANSISNSLVSDLYDLYPLEDRWTIVPIPQHWLTRIRRRFDLNQILVKRIAKQCNMRTTKLLRNISRITQGQCKTKIERINNAKEKFSLKTTAKAPRNIILFDDVVATGATMKNCEKLLRSAGAKNVVWLSIAH